MLLDPVPYPSRALFVQGLVCTVHVKIKDSKIAQQASAGEEGAGLCTSRAFVCFVRALFCPFSLPLGVGDWLRFAIVAFPGLLFYELFWSSKSMFISDANHSIALYSL